MCVACIASISVVKVFVFVYVNVIVCDFVHQCKSVCLSACVQVFHVNLLFYECCDTGSLCVIACNEPSCLCVDLFQFIYV